MPIWQLNFSNSKCLLAYFAWLVAAVWLWRVVPVLWMLPRIPDLLHRRYSRLSSLAELPSVTVIVPAKDEASAIEPCLRSLLSSDLETVKIIAVDDRSSDTTGELMDRLAHDPAAQNRLRVLHVQELPERWLGKPNAMAMAASQASSDWLLFTDADVIFAPDALPRALMFAITSGADHVVLYPTLILRGWGEYALASFFQSMSGLAGRPWKIPDPRATHDYIGVGAFNLIRRPVYEALGGFTALRMEVLEDMRLGYLVKRAGYAQRVAFGKDLIRIRWAESAPGMIRNLTKNLYAAFRFRAPLVLGVCAAVAIVTLTPFLALWFSGAARWAGVTTLIALFLLNLRYWRRTDIAPRYLALFPFAALVFLWMLLHSMLLVLWRGGVLWRGTFYPLKELRRQAGPFW